MSLRTNLIAFNRIASKIKVSADKCIEIKVYNQTGRTIDIIVNEITYKLYTDTKNSVTYYHFPPSACCEERDDIFYIYIPLIADTPLEGNVLVQREFIQKTQETFVGA